MLSYVKKRSPAIVTYCVSVVVLILLQSLFVWGSWSALFGGFVQNHTLVGVKTFWTVIVILCCFDWRKGLVNKSERTKTLLLSVFFAAIVWSFGIFTSWMFMKHVGLGTLVGDWWSYHLDLYVTVCTGFGLCVFFERNTN